MSHHLQVVAVCVLWAVVFVTFCGTLATDKGSDRFDRPTTPRHWTHPYWVAALALLFILAVGLTAWVSQ